MTDADVNWFGFHDLLHTGSALSFPPQSSAKCRVTRHQKISLFIRMFLVLGWLCLLFIKDLNAERLLVFKDHNISFVDTDKNMSTDIAFKIRDIMRWDYHYTRGFLYFVEPIDKNTPLGNLYRFRLKEENDAVTAKDYDLVAPDVMGIAVDWTHERLFFVVYGTLIRSELDGTKVEVVVSNEKATAALKDETNSTGYVLSIHVDPYDEILFMAMTALDLEGYYIFKSDINGTKLQTHQEWFYQNIACIVVEVNEKRLYAMETVNGRVHVTDYEGKKLGEFNLKEKVFYLMNALGNSIYTSHYNGTKIYFSKFKMNSNYSMAERQDLISFDSSYSSAGVAVYDPRRQRRKKNGKYECEQNDCSYDCEVLSDGAHCTCPPDQTLDSNQKTCTGGCKVPDPPDHRRFTRYPCPEGSECGLSPGAFVAHGDLLTVNCDPDYFKIQGVNSFSSEETIVSCNQSVWFPRLPKCYKPCPPLTSLTVKFSCYQGPQFLSCDKPMLPGTVAEYSCKEYHTSNEKNQTNTLRCTTLGKWNRIPPPCTPNCGKSNLHSYEIETTILGDKFSELGNFPWHAGLYRMNNKSWDAVCGGTLVSPKLILTAGHCVTKSCAGCKAMAVSPQDVMVALGKRYRSWNRTDKAEVKRAISEVLVHQDYVGSSVNYGQDIAILVMESAVEVTNYVMPACVDFSQAYLKQFNEDKTLQGYVAGWGVTEECSSFSKNCGSVSEDLKYAQTPIIDFIECFNLSQSLGKGTISSSRLTSDKFCAGNGSASVVQSGDSGGGLTFEFDRLHYVYGVTSVKLKLEIRNQTFYSFSAFTSITKYLPWLKTQFYKI